MVDLSPLVAFRWLASSLSRRQQRLVSELAEFAALRNSTSRWRCTDRIAGARMANTTPGADDVSGVGPGAR